MHTQLLLQQEGIAWNQLKLGILSYMVILVCAQIRLYCDVVI
jgi:hypothetical protein